MLLLGLVAILTLFPALTEPASLTLVDSNYDISKRPPRWVADFNEDGFQDSATYSQGQPLIVKDGKTEEVTHLPLPATVWDVSMVSLRSDGKYPSFVIAAVGWNNATDWFLSTSQHVIHNLEGRWIPRILDLHIMGRGVDCIRIGNTARCLFAAYDGGSQVVDIDDKLRVVRKDKALRIPKLGEKGPDPTSYLDGGTYYLMKGVWTDWSGDGRLDIYAVGQHAKIYALRQQPSGYYNNNKKYWVNPGGEYIHTVALTPACLYNSMEFGGDFVHCYSESGWDRLKLPEGPYKSGQGGVWSWQIELETFFAAKHLKTNSWRLFKLSP